LRQDGLTFIYRDANDCSGHLLDRVGIVSFRQVAFDDILFRPWRPFEISRSKTITDHHVAPGDQDLDFGNFLGLDLGLKLRDGLCHSGRFSHVANKECCGHGG